MKRIIVFDQSTSATKAMLFSEQSEFVDSASIEHRQLYPRPGWVEHDPEEILRNCYACAELLLKTAGLHPSNIDSVAITNQRETVIVWDKRTGKPVYNAIVWQCNRGAHICDTLIARGFEPVVKQKTGLIIDPYFSASGIQWILENVDGAARDAREGHLLFGTMDSWLLWNFTSGRSHATDFTNASRTLLFNLHTLDWDPELLELFAIPASMTPKVLPCDSHFGTTTLNGLLPERPIAGVIGDSHGALVGQRCFACGTGKATYGTGSSIMVNIGAKPLTAPRGLVTSVGFAAGGTVSFVFEGNVHFAGATINWLQNELRLIQSADETEALATSIENTDGVYLVPAFTGLGAPWWDSDAKGLICGLNRGTTRAHLVRAALESTAFQVMDLVTLIQGSGIDLQELRVDGGGVKNRFLMQFQADILQIRLLPGDIREASALGAVLMNGLAEKRHAALNELAVLRSDAGAFVPRIPKSESEAQYANWKKAVHRALMK